MTTPEIAVQAKAVLSQCPGERVLLRELARRIQLATGVPASRAFAQLLGLVEDQQELRDAGLRLTEDRQPHSGYSRIRYLSVATGADLAGWAEGVVVDCSIATQAPCNRDPGLLKQQKGC